MAQVEDHLAVLAPHKPRLATAAPSAADAAAAEALGAEGGSRSGGADALAAEAAATPAAPAADEAAALAADPDDPQVKAALGYHARLSKLLRVLSGETPIALALEFLYSHNHADLQVGGVMQR